MGRYHRRHRREQQPEHNRPAAENNQRAHRPPRGQSRQHQVTGNQRAENRHLQQAILIAGGLFATDDNHRRLGNPRQQRQADKTGRQRAGDEAQILQHQAIIAAQLFHRQLLAHPRRGFRHRALQAHKGNSGQHGKQHEHHFPRQDVDPGRPHQRPQQRGNQRNVRHQGGDFDAHRLLKRLLNGGISHRADEAQTNPLQKAQQRELLNRLRQQRGQTGDDKPHHPGEHHRSTADTIRQRPQQPLQKHTAGEIGGHRGRYPFITDLKLFHHREHSRLDHVVADISGKFV